ncbi:hypothetical protein RHS04_05683 [Rhizoctonia solani]|uniref:Uncharacterized protein n=1 Tax=Rhizoctonia solani TaxID=456999 RepID=A0A8H7H8Z4_9AGAM
MTLGPSLRTPIKTVTVWFASALRGPENLESAPGLAIVGEHSGAFGMMLGSARKCSPSNPDPLDPNEEVPKGGALQSAPGFLGPP